MAYVDEELSLGDFVLTGGEPAALAVVDAVTRLLPGVLGNAYSAEEESFGDGLLEYPQYTRPAVFRGASVPGVLKSGDHGRVRDWRHGQSLLRTQERRPSLMTGRELSDKDVRLLKEARQQGTDGKEESAPN
jgi:tRNA (guanine37-N1)-methyltransferase